MAVYVAIYAISCLIALMKLWAQNTRQSLVVVFFVAPLSFFVGYRYFIGVDWITYEIMFLDVYRSNFLAALSYGDSAYSLVTWVVSRLDGQVWDSNLVCAVIFCTGLGFFCNSQRRPGLAFVVNIPILLVITAMGYTRQATAVGCILLAFNQFRGSINWRWLSWLILATLFHKSAIVMFPIFILAGTKNRWVTYIIGGVLTVALISTIISSNLNLVLSLYFEGDLESSGTLPRIAIGALAGAGYFLIRRPKEVFEERAKLVRNLSVFMIALVPAYFIVPSTTVIDRMGVLLIAFQGATLSGLAYTLRSSALVEGLFSSIVAAAYGTAFLVWLTYATFASYWLPYDNVLFVRWL